MWGPKYQESDSEWRLFKIFWAAVWYNQRLRGDWSGSHESERLCREKVKLLKQAVKRAKIRQWEWKWKEGREGKAEWTGIGINWSKREVNQGSWALEIPSSLWKKTEMLLRCDSIRKTLAWISGTCHNHCRLWSMVACAESITAHQKQK